MNVGRGVKARVVLGAKKATARLLHNSPAQAICRAVHEIPGRTLTILAYHRIAARPEGRTYPFDLGLLSATPEEFHWQMGYLRRECNVLPLSSVSAYLSGRLRLPARAVAVTFDDGFIDNYEVAFPILREFSIPATIFVTTAHIGSDRPFWFEMTVYAMMRAAPRTIQIDGLAMPLPTGDSEQERRASAIRLLNHLKSLPFEQLRCIVSTFEHELGASLKADEFSASRTMNWDQVREMADAGIEFGSHSANHPVLTRLTSDALRFELTEAKRTLERELGRPVTQLAYPVGRSYAFSEEVVFEAGRAGYRLAVSYIPGANREGAFRHFELRRQNVEMHVDRSMFRALVTIPDWYY